MDTIFVLHGKNYTSQIKNCMVISQKLLPKLPTEGFDLRDIVKEEQEALYQTSLPGNQHRGKEQQEDLQKRMLTNYSCMENRKLWRTITGVLQMMSE